jgi:hypothetical protein
MIHVSLHSVGIYHKKFGWQNKKTKIYFTECPTGALGKKDSLPSTRTRLSAKITAVSFRRRLTTLCRAPQFAECVSTRQRCLCRVYSCAKSPALGKRGRYREQDFAECGTRQILPCRVPDKKNSAKRRALGKEPDFGSDSRKLSIKKISIFFIDCLHSPHNIFLIN